MISKNILLFPTLITVGKREVDELEKESWFSAYLEMSDKDGKSMDFLGYQSIHHDKRFMKVFGDICNTIREYLNTLNVDTTILDINITKTWFNVKTNSSNPPHNHSENHISFTYYPHIHKKYSDKTLVFYQQENRNEPYDNFLNLLNTEWNDINCVSYSIPVYEGDIIIFPSKLPHSVDGDDSKKLESFETIENLKNSRFCVGGDVILTRKNTKNYNRLLTPIENWRKF